MYGQYVYNTEVLNAAPILFSNGVDQIWDLTQVISAGSALRTECLPNTDTAFAQSNVMLKDSLAGSTSYRFYRSAPDSMMYEGFRTSSIKGDYSDPEKILEFPFTLNDQFVDSFRFERDGIYGHGYVTAIADGYGMVQLPNGIFTNVLKITYQRAYTDSLPNIGNVGFYLETQQVFYKPGFLSPLATFFTQEKDVSGFPQYYHSASYLASQALGVNEELRDRKTFTLYPNPANDLIHIIVPEGEAERICVTDLVGRVTYQATVTGESELVIPVATWPKGLYFVSVQMNDHNRYNKQFVLE